MAENREYLNTVQDSINALRREHAELDRQLVEMDGRQFLTPEEQLERRRIQKLKLLKKDKIELLRLRNQN